LPDDGLGEKVYIGIWGQRRLDYLKNHKWYLYLELLMSSKLWAHLHEIDVTTSKRWKWIIKQMMKAQGVTEQLKANDQLTWVRKANNIRACANEIIQNELIYD